MLVCEDNKFCVLRSIPKELRTLGEFIKDFKSERLCIRRKLLIRFHILAFTFDVGFFLFCTGTGFLCGTGATCLLLTWG